MIVRIKLLNAHAIEPIQRDGDSGADLHATHDVDVLPGEREKVRFGVAFEIPDGWGGFVLPRSGLASSGRLALTGVVDCAYRGEVCATLYNSTRETWHVKRGDRVAQLVIMLVPRVTFDTCTELSETDRGANGFGSSGVGRRNSGNGG